MKPGTDSSIVTPPAKALYKQIEGELRSKIRRADWPVGSMLPSRRDLARHFGVSTLTVERAIGRLVDEGLLRSDDRRGTFVASPAQAQTPTPPAASLSPVATPQTRVPTASYTVGIIASLYDLRPAAEYDPLILNDFWVRLLIHALEQNFAEAGESTRFFNRVTAADRPPLPPAAAVDAAVAEGVDAIALIGMGVPTHLLNQALDRLEEKGVPAVCAWTGKLMRPVPHVFIDDQSAGYQAAQHLIRQGASDLFLFSPFRGGWQEDRWVGARAAAANAGLPDEAITVFPETPPRWDADEDPTPLSYRAAQEAFEAGYRPESVLCPNDGVAFGWLKAAEERGMVAGRDYRIVGFDDHPDARNRHLTTMRPAGEAMGQEMARLLRQVLRGQTDSQQVSLRSRLIPRDSTRLRTGEQENRQV